MIYYYYYFIFSDLFKRLSIIIISINNCSLYASHFQGILQRLDEGVVIGDGGFVFALEKRGYVKAGPWTPEASVEEPEAGRYSKVIYTHESPHSMSDWPRRWDENNTCSCAV